MMRRLGPERTGIARIGMSAHSLEQSFTTWELWVTERPLVVCNRGIEETRQ
jgi:hypothetical protein